MVEVSLEPGGMIRGRLVIPARATDVELWVEGSGPKLESVLYPDRSFEVAGVPSGKFTVVAEARLAGRPIRATVPARRGDTVELALRGE